MFLSIIQEENHRAKLLISQEEEDETWVLNSSCSHHMTKQKELLSYLDHSFSSNIKIGDEKFLEVIAKGDMLVPTKKGTMKVKSIYFPPNLKQSLLSVGRMLENNYKLVFEDKMCKIYDKNRGGRLVTTIKMNKNNLFTIKFMEQGGGFSSMRIDDSATLWHFMKDITLSR